MSQQSPRIRATERAAEQARLTGDLLSDLSDSLASLGALISLAEGEPGHGGGGDHLVRLRDALDRMRRLVGDMGEEARGRSPSPDVEFRPAELAREVCDRWIVTAPALRAALHCDLPTDARIQGRAALFSHVLERLLGHAERSATGQVRIALRLERHSGTPGVRVEVEDDGGDDLDEDAGIAVAHWAAARLGGRLSLRRGDEIGGTCRSLWLPLARGVLRDRAAAVLAGRAVVLMDAADPRRVRVARRLRREGALVIELSPEYLPTVDSLAATVATTDADVVLLRVQLGALSGVAVLEALGRIAPEMVDRVLLLSGADEGPATSAPEAAADGWPALRQALLDHIAALTDATP